MTVTVNGEVYELEDGATVSDVLLFAAGSDSRRGIAVAVDGEVVPRARWESTELSPGQRIEVLQAVQGG